MTTRALTQVALRMWSVTLLARAVIRVPILVGLMTQQADTADLTGMLFSARLSTAAAVALEAGLAFAVFGYAPALAKRITDGDDQDVSISVDAQTLMAVGLAVFGITVLVNGVLELGPTLYAWLMTRGDASSTVSIVEERRWTTISRGSLEVLIGAALFVGRGALLRGWRKVRSQET